LLYRHSALIYYVCGYPTMHLYINITNNWYTIETQPIGPFVLEGLSLFTKFSTRR